MDGFVNIQVCLRPVVYALVLKGEVVYIGKAKKPITRLYVHVNNWRRHVKGLKPLPWMRQAMKFDDVWVRPCDIADLATVEKEMIERYRPKHNVQHNGKVNQPKPKPKYELPARPITLVVGGTTVVIGQPKPMPKPERPVIERRPLYVATEPTPLVFVPLKPPAPQPMSRAYWDAPLERRI